MVLNVCLQVKSYTIEHGDKIMCLGNLHSNIYCGYYSNANNLSTKYSFHVLYASQILLKSPKRNSGPRRISIHAPHV